MEYTAGFLFAMTKGNLVFSPWSFRTQKILKHLPELILRLTTFLYYYCVRNEKGKMHHFFYFSKICCPFWMVHQLHHSEALRSEIDYRRRYIMHSSTEWKQQIKFISTCYYYSSSQKNLSFDIKEIGLFLSICVWHRDIVLSLFDNVCVLHLCSLPNPFITAGEKGEKGKKCSHWMAEAEWDFVQVSGI